MGTYDDFQREVLDRQHQLLAELGTPGATPKRARAGRRGHQVARLLRSVANRLDPDPSRDLTPASPR